MQTTLQNVLPLEIQSRDYQGKQYHNLIVFEFGQRFPAVRSIQVSKEDLPHVEKLIGKKQTIVCNLYEGKGRISLSYENHAA